MREFTELIYRIMGESHTVASLKSHSSMGDDSQKLGPWGSLHSLQAAQQPPPTSSGDRVGGRACELCKF